MVKLAFYKHQGDLFDRLVRWWTRSPYSHVEILLTNGFSYSSSRRDGGVRMKFIEFDPEHWDFLEATWVSEVGVLEEYQKTKNQKYSYSELLFNQVLNLGLDSNKNAVFCSAWCAKAIGIPDPYIHSPKTLCNLVQKLNWVYRDRRK